jgi:hypothetical protein
MARVEKAFDGIVHGRVIELAGDPGVRDGTTVRVVITLADPSSDESNGNRMAIRSSAGALADSWTDEDDQILHDIQQGRKAVGAREVDD